MTSSCFSILSIHQPTPPLPTPQLTNPSPSIIYSSVNRVSIGSENGLLPFRCQAIIWTNGGILLIGPLGKQFRWNFKRNEIFSLKKCIWKYRLRNGVHFARGRRIKVPEISRDVVSRVERGFLVKTESLIRRETLKKIDPTICLRC